MIKAKVKITKEQYITNETEIYLYAGNGFTLDLKKIVLKLDSVNYIIKGSFASIYKENLKGVTINA